MLKHHNPLTNAAVFIALCAIGSLLHPGCAPQDPCAGITCDTHQRCESGACVSTCTTPNTTCGQDCTNLQTDPNHCGQCNNKCQTNAVCSGGTCLALCPTGTTNCDGSCINISEDPQHCGQCNKSCPQGQVCAKGSCQPQCDTNTTNCGGFCADTSSHRSHCGQCNNTCDNGSDCKDGTCTKICTDTLSLCDGACTQTNNDPNHCGQCGNKCSKDTTCLAGQCVLSCPSYLTLCADTCVNLQTNPTHCGTCGNTCPSGQRCEQGTCTLTCQATQTNCSGTCVQLDTDRAHCGKCDNICPSGTLCSKGSCQLTCTSGTTQCGMSCVDLMTSTQHCGACDNQCASREQCDQGKCSLTCKAPRSACGGSCFDLTTSPDHCGKCSTICPSGQACQQGKCVALCQQGQTTCNNTCADLKIDDNHCGTCGNKCSSGLHCKEGACVSLWALEGTTTGVSVATAIAVGPKGNVFVCGSFTNTLSMGGKTYGTMNKSGAYVAKLDPQGKTLWFNTLNANCWNIAASPKGNVSITGTFQQTLTIGSKTLTSAGNSDAFIATWSAQGALLWAERMGSPEHDQPGGRELGVDQAGALYFRGIIGLGATFGSISLKNQTREEFIAKVNADGSFGWLKSLGPQNTCSMISIATMPGGDTYVAGRGYKACTFGSLTSPTTKVHVAILKIDTKGNFQKLTTWEADSYGIRIVAAGPSHLYVSGDFKKPTKCGTTTLTPRSDTPNNNYVVRLDESGVCYWAHTFASKTRVNVTIDSKAVYGKELIVSQTMGTPFYIDDKELPVKGQQGHLLTVHIDQQGKFKEQSYTGIPQATMLAAPNSVNIQDLAVDNQRNKYIIGDFVGAFGFTHYKLKNQSTVAFQGWNFFIAKNLP